MGENETRDDARTSPAEKSATEELIETLAASTHVRGVLVRYLEARHENMGRTVLLPSVDVDQIHVIRGKAQFMSELAALCITAEKRSEEQGDFDG